MPASAWVNDASILRPPDRLSCDAFDSEAQPLNESSEDCCGSLGGRYRVNVEGLPGRPDIANKKKRRAIFVHGCYWHHHEGCARAGLPKRNRAFWREKFVNNRDRDKKKEYDLRSAGFAVLVIWECELEDQPALARRLDEFWSQQPE